MKIQMRDGKIVDEPLNKAQRLINKGDAHPVKEEVRVVAKQVIKELIPIAKTEAKIVEIDESIIFREPGIVYKLVKKAKKNNT